MPDYVRLLDGICEYLLSTFLIVISRSVFLFCFWNSFAITWFRRCFDLELALAWLRLAEEESGGTLGSDVLWFNFKIGLVWFDISMEDRSMGMVYW